MPGILPETTSGGVITRTAAGVATAPAGVNNSYVPAATFGASGSLTALPADCTARLTPDQTNAIISEFLSFAEAINPAGSWTLPALNNLAVNWVAWFSGTGVGTFEGRMREVQLGTFTGVTIRDNPTIEEALQDLETELESLQLAVWTII